MRNILYNMMPEWNSLLENYENNRELELQNIFNLGK